jgi:hypothetical protein
MSEGISTAGFSSKTFLRDSIEFVDGSDVDEFAIESLLTEQFQDFWPHLLVHLPKALEKLDGMRWASFITAFRKFFAGPPEILNLSPR